MKVTEVRVRKILTEGRLRAVVSITFNDCFAVHDVKVVEGRNGLFVAMPNKRLEDGTYRDIAHPLNAEFRDVVQSIVMEAYNNAYNNAICQQ